MARHAHRGLVDDRDGSPAAETVRFGLDQWDFEIDLSAENAKGCGRFSARTLEPLVSSGRSRRGIYDGGAVSRSCFQLPVPYLLHCPGGLSDTLSQLGIALQLIEQHSHPLGCLRLCFKGKPIEEAVLWVAEVECEADRLGWPWRRSRRGCSLRLCLRLRLSFWLDLCLRLWFVDDCRCSRGSTFGCTTQARYRARSSYGTHCVTAESSSSHCS